MTKLSTTTATTATTTTATTGTAKPTTKSICSTSTTSTNHNDEKCGISSTVSTTGSSSSSATNKCSTGSTVLQLSVKSIVYHCYISMIIGLLIGSIVSQQQSILVSISSVSSSYYFDFQSFKTSSYYNVNSNNNYQNQQSLYPTQEKDLYYKYNMNDNVNEKHINNHRNNKNSEQKIVITLDGSTTTTTTTTTTKTNNPMLQLLDNEIAADQQQEQPNSIIQTNCNYKNNNIKYFEALVHPAMTIMSQERRKYPITKINQQSTVPNSNRLTSSSSSTTTTNDDVPVTKIQVAVLAFGSNNNNTDTDTDTDYCSGTVTGIQDQIQMYRTVHSIIILCLIPKTRTTGLTEYYYNIKVIIVKDNDDNPNAVMMTTNVQYYNAINTTNRTVLSSWITETVRGENLLLDVLFITDESLLLSLSSTKNDDNDTENDDDDNNNNNGMNADTDNTFANVDNDTNHIILTSVVKNLLSNDAIIVTPAGTYPKSGTQYVPSYYYINNKQNYSNNNRNTNSYINNYNAVLASIANIAEEYQFQKLFEYSESISQQVSNTNNNHYRKTSSRRHHRRIIQQQQRFIVILKNSAVQSNWIATDAETNLAIYKNMKQSSSISIAPLQYFDGSTMSTYIFPSRIAEDMFCKDDAFSTASSDDTNTTTTDNDSTTSSTCYGKHGFDSDRENIPSSLFSVRVSDVKNGGRGVYAVTNVTNGSYLILEEGANVLYVLPNTYSILEKCVSRFSRINNSTRADSDNIVITTKYLNLLDGYIYGYGWGVNDFGRFSSAIDTGILTFVNHGCNGTNNVNNKFEFTEMSLDDNISYDTVFEKNDDETYDLLFDFHHYRSIWSDSISSSSSSIMAGDELLDNYLLYGGKTLWDKNLQELKSLCSGLVDLATVLQYEQANKV